MIDEETIENHDEFIIVIQLICALAGREFKKGGVQGCVKLEL